VDVEEVLRQTFGEDKEIKSGVLDVGAHIELKGIPQLEEPVRLRLRGPFISATDDKQAPKFDLDFSVDAAGQTLRAGAVSTGDRGFIEIQGQAVQISDEEFERYKSLLREDGEQEEGVSLSSLGINPDRWLRNPEYIGSEDVGGAETLHVRAGIDVPRLLEDVNRVLSRAEQVEGQRARQLTDAERRQLADAVRNARIDVWTGEDDKILRRLNLNIDFEVDDKVSRRAQGLESGTIRLDLSYSGVNDEQEIKAPADAAPPPPAGEGQGDQQGEPEDLSPYEQCIADAEGDIAKLQECAGLASSG
jgi:hypothetical protein